MNEKNNTTPTLGIDLHEMLELVAERARFEAVQSKNFHAAALYVVLEALLAQSREQGTHVAVYLSPVGEPK